MTPDAWAELWKWLVILGTGAFGVISLWVIVWGGRDVVQLLRDLREAPPEDDTNEEVP